MKTTETLGRTTGEPRSGVAVIGGHVQGYLVRVDRMPRPDETVIGSAFGEVEDGGKGSHQAIAVGRLGIPCSFVGAVGRDPAGERALEWLHQAGVRTDGVLRCETQTGAGLVILDAQGVPSIVSVMGANDVVTADYVTSVAHVILRHRVLLVSLEIPAAGALRAMEIAHAAGLTVILNPAPFSPFDVGSLRHVDVLTPNEVEAAEMLEWLATERQGPSPDPGGPAGGEPGRALARRLLERAAIPCVVVTCGERGAEVAVRQGAAVSEFRVEAMGVEAVDTTGAGDAFNAGLASALARGADIEGAVRFANVVAACSVTRPGSLPSLPGADLLARFARDHGVSLPSWLDGV